MKTVWKDYIPNNKLRTAGLFLSGVTVATSGISAVGVAAHEAGHAVQYAESYGPIKFRTAIYPVCNLGSRLAMPLVLFGLLFNFYFLIDVGIIFFAIALLFQLITLPVEFNASKRAITSIRNFGILQPDEVSGAKKVLTAAAMTYIASFLVSLAQLLRLLAIANRRR